MKQNEGKSLNWREIASTFFPNRSPDAIRNKYKKMLENPKVESK
jgi:hypothetical protein